MFAGGIMTKLYRSPVQIELDMKHQPKRFRWLGRWHRILKCTMHEENRRWNQRFKGDEIIFRCETYQGMICDIYSERGTGTWILERIWD